VQGYKEVRGQVLVEDDAVVASRLNMLKKTFRRITDKREQRVIDRLVQEYRDSILTPEKAYSAIMAIAELRWAGSDIGQQDLQ